MSRKIEYVKNGTTEETHWRFFFFFKWYMCVIRNEYCLGPDCIQRHDTVTNDVRWQTTSISCRLKNSTIFFFRCHLKDFHFWAWRSFTDAIALSVHQRNEMRPHTFISELRPFSCWSVHYALWVHLPSDACPRICSPNVRLGPSPAIKSPTILLYRSAFLIIVRYCT